MSILLLSRSEAKEQILETIGRNYCNKNVKV